jgi:hypothetical protein
MKLTGWHGEARGTIVGPFANPELYVALDRSLAETYAEPDGRVLTVSFKATRPLVLSDAASAARLIRESRMIEASGDFHGHDEVSSSHVFCEWARAQGYDAVVFEPACFEQTDDSDAAYQDWNDVAGTFGDPQLIILDPRRATLSA